MEVMWTIEEAAKQWGISTSTVRKYIAQGRIKCSKIGRDFIIFEDIRPERLQPGELTQEQRAAWKK